ncbi:DUF2141 domain-containing protein [Croceicoccus naphthovorans]|uniref:Uncharacterized protein n=1 Tax=Croceicoccus naphthovorans TaxID=1348774 RepID=A0A0G3XEB4_9SPHN|nr:DUF2141 domain-containing protein [Croceicoccus naphthovorans]AKM08949.1 hypothetical protein AB433_01510 [Croceicoccus naphthovorans]MBB3989262.1 uncharacterized protein (DUF2141 family) [Croceicoccus naphthovorans]
MKAFTPVKKWTHGAAAFAALAGLGTLAAVPAPAEAAPAQCKGDLSGKGWLNVEVTGVKSSSGLIAVTIYADDSSKFLVSKGSLDVVRFPAQQGTFRGCVKLPGNGVYAIAVYHDEDGSRKINRTGLGLPAEGFGFSNNPSTLAGIPAFRSVRLNVPKPGLTTRINMRYP